MGNPYARFDNYGLRHLPSHFIDIEWWDELEAHLTDLRFVEAKCAAGMAYDLVEDYDVALNGLPPRGHTSVEEFARFVRSQSHELARSPVITFQQAANQPDTMAPAQAARRQFETGLESRPWLRCVNKPQVPTTCLMTLHGHTSSVCACAFSPDGHYIVSASKDGTIWLWNAQTGDRIRTLTGHVCAFSPNGDRIVSGEGETLKIWDVSTGNCITTLSGHEGRVSTCVYSPDGTLILSGSWDHTLKLWDPETGKMKGTLGGHSWQITSCAFSPDGKRIVSGTGDISFGELKLWDVATGTEIASLGGPFMDSVRSCSFSPDGELILSGHSNGRLQLWDATTGSRLNTRFGQRRSLYACSFSPDGHWIVSGSAFMPLTLWDVATGQELVSFMGWRAEHVFTCAFSPDGKRIVSSSGDRLRIWDVSGKERLSTYAGQHGDRVNDCTFSPDGTQFASASSDGTLKLWDAVSGQLRSTLAGHVGHREWVEGAAYSPDGTQVVSASFDTTIKLWNAINGRIIATLVSDQPEPVTACSVSPDGRFIASGLHSGGIILWGIESRQEERHLISHSEAVNACAFSPDGMHLVSASSDKTLKLWNLATGAVVATLSGHAGIVCDCAISPDSTFILSGSTDHTLQVWNLLQKEANAIVIPHPDEVRACAYSPNGRYVASGCADRKLRLFDVVEWREHCTYPMEWVVTAVAWHPTGHLLVVGNDAGQVSLLEMQNFPTFPPRVTAVQSAKLWFLSAHTSFCCPHCRYWCKISATALGTEISCSRCSGYVRLNSFTLRAR